MTDEADASSGSEPTLATFADWYEALRHEQEGARKLRESLRDVARSGVEKADDDALRSAARSLSRLKLQTAAHLRAATALASALEEEVERRIRTRREGLLDALRQAAEEAGVPWKRVADDPLEIALGPLTARFDSAEKATLLLGREPILQQSAEASIVAASVRLQETMRSERMASADFFDLLQRAWRMALLARDAAVGERVDLVDLLHPLGLLRTAPDTWRRQREGIAPMERWRLAYQLYRLRKEGALQVGGWRLELAAATLSTTRDPRNVLWIEEGGGRGQFYGSLRFSRVGDGGEKSSTEGAGGEPAGTRTETRTETRTDTQTDAGSADAEQTDLDALLDEIDDA